MNNVSFGIDLGTTNSCISLIQSNTTVPKIIPLKDGNTLPSCVMLNEDGSYTIGKDAYEHRYEDSAIYSVKRFMGTDEDILLRNGDASVILKPEEVSSIILKEIAIQASKYVGNDIIKDVTITVPAHFNDAQRRATQKAGELAGLNVINIINEPTSAGLLYGLDNAKGNETILVYDLGGGTFDVSILRVVKNLRKFPLLDLNMNGEYNDTSISIVANDGDIHLGGDDIDENVLHFVTKKLGEKLGFTQKDVEEKLLGNIKMEELKLRLEKFKKSGLTLFSYTINGYESVSVELSGKEFEEECYRPIFNRTFEYVSRAMASAGVTQVNHIVLVGGSTKSKIIQKMLKEKFPNIDIMNSFEPDLSVALGASISSATTLGISKIATITDVVPMSIGVLVNGQDGNKKFSKILRKDTQLPCRSIQFYGVGDSDSNLVSINVYQGESTYDISKLHHIGTVNVPCSEKEIAIEFVCDLNGVLSCFMHSGKDIQKIDIDYSINNLKENRDEAKDLTVDTSMLDKGQKFFYDKHIKKLVNAGVSDEEISKMFTPLIVLTDMQTAKKNFDTLMKSVNN